MRLSPLESWLLVIAVLAAAAIVAMLIIRDLERAVRNARDVHEFRYASAVSTRRLAIDVLAELDDPDLTLAQRADLRHELESLRASDVRRELHRRAFG